MGFSKYGYGPRGSPTPRPHVYTKTGPEPKPASISDVTAPRDHTAVVLFAIDRLARSPGLTVRRRTSKKAPDLWFVK